MTSAPLRPIGSPADSSPRTVAVTGASGLIGAALVRSLESDGARVLRLVRREARDASEIAWHPERGAIESAKLVGVDAVVHLAGENLVQRWTAAAKRRIRDSRVQSTTLLAETLAGLSQRPRALLSGSAIGIYGNRGDEMLSESSSPGDGFLADVCRAWEAATLPAQAAGIRVVHLRTGLVVAREGGVLAKMLPAFRFGVGGPLGNGRQWMSWIALGDIVRAIRFLLDGSLDGPMNLVAPEPVTNREFSRTLGRVVRRPALVPVPRFAVAALFGEMADEALLASQRVQPERLVRAGFEFEFRDLESALERVLR